MAKEKLTLTELKIESCVTSLTGDQLDKVKGGVMSVQGRRNTYKVRWTAVDTRAEAEAMNSRVTPGLGKI